MKDFPSYPLPRWPEGTNLFTAHRQFQFWTPFSSRHFRDVAPRDAMAGEAGKNRTVLLATEKAFAAGAVAKIETVVKEAKYTLKHFGGIECLLGFLHVYWFQGNESNKIIMRRRTMGIGQAVPSTWLAVQPCSGHGFHIIFSTPGLCLHTHTTNYKYDIKYGMQDWAHPFGLIFHKNTVSEVGLSISL